MTIFCFDEFSVLDDGTIGLPVGIAELIKGDFTLYSMKRANVENDLLEILVFFFLCKCIKDNICRIISPDRGKSWILPKSSFEFFPEFNIVWVGAGTVKKL